LLAGADNYRARQKGTPRKKIDISGIVADIFTKLTEFTGEGSDHISCKFCWNNTCGSKETTV